MQPDLSLPMAADLLVPHRQPLCLVTRLLEFSGQRGIVEAVIGPENIFLNEDGTLPPLILVELIAQASAAVKGYNDLRQGNEIKKGFLVDIREMRFTGTCLTGDILLIRVEIVRTFSGFSIINGEVDRNGEVIASGTLKILVPGDGDVPGWK